MQAVEKEQNRMRPDAGLLILVPVYNGARSIRRVTDSIRAALQESSIPFSLLVVNDGSTDSTERFLSENRIHYISHTRNQGKGAALKTGFRYALDNGYTLIATIDADGQHDPRFLPEMIRKATEENFDLVIGTRKKEPKKMSPARIFSNTLTSWLISLRTGCRIPDSQSGFRIIRAESLKAITLNTNRYETESEILIRGGKKKWRFGFVQVSTIYADETSHIRHFLDTWRFIKMYFKTIFT